MVDAGGAAVVEAGGAAVVVPGAAGVVVAGASVVVVVGPAGQVSPATSESVIILPSLRVFQPQTRLFHFGQVQTEVMAPKLPPLDWISSPFAHLN